MSIFLDQNKDLIFFHSLNEELIDEIVEQTCIVYTVNAEHSNKDDLYGESTTVVYNEGVSLTCLISIEPPEVTTNLEQGGVGRLRTLEIYLHRKTLIDDTVFFQEGDLIFWDDQFFKITKVTQPQKIQGQATITWDIIVSAVGTPIKEITTIS